MTPGMIIDGEGHVLAHIQNGQPVGEVDPVVANWFEKGVPSFKGYLDGDVIEEVPSVIAPANPIFLLGVMDEAERRGWTVVDEDSGPEEKSGVSDQLGHPFGGDPVEKTGTHEGAEKGWEKRRLTASSKDVVYGGPSANFNAATQKRLNDEFSKAHGFVNGQRTIKASNGHEVIFTIKQVQPTYSIYSHGNDVPPTPQWELRGRVGKSNLQVRALQPSSHSDSWWINATHKWSGSGDMTSFERLADHIADRAVSYGIVEPVEKSGTSEGAKLGWEHRERGANIEEDRPEDLWQEDLGTSYGALKNAPPAEDVYAVTDDELKLGRRIEGQPDEDWQDDHFGRWSNRLTEHQQKAIGVYVGDDYGQINKYLRGTYDPPETPQYLQPLDALGMDETLASLDAAFKRVPALDQDIIALRGVSSESFAEMLHEHAGGTFSEPGYTSTTVDSMTAYSFSRTEGSTGMIASIKIPAGSHVLPASDFEGEILLPRQARFRILAVDLIGHRAQLEYLP